MSLPYLSKSDFLSGIQCPKMLWLMRHEPDKIAESSTHTMQLFQKGFAVGDLACELFPGGKKIPYLDTPVADRVALTRQYMDEGVVDIYEATFEYEGVMAMVDILHRNDEGLWEIYEVKSSTDLKDIYLQDTALQYYVLDKCGVPLGNATLIHLNKYYTRGEELDLPNFFFKQGITKPVKEKQAEIPDIIAGLREMLQGPVPDQDIGPWCTNPYECRAKGHCWSHIPEYSIFNVSHLTGEQKFGLYRQGILLQSDITDYSDLTAKQIKEISVNLDKGVDVDKFSLKSWLDKVTYPLYYLDFESFQQAIPEFPGTTPYCQIPFQYSLHIEQADGQIEHREFLAPEGKDPREAVARRLVQDIPPDVMIVAYNMSFEKMIIKNLARQIPALRQPLQAMAHNMIDLLQLFQKRLVYHYEQMGSNSIKNVLPAWVPAMKEAYTSLEGVHNGSDAMSYYASLPYIEDQQEKEKIKESLLRYCEIDTLAMVKLMDRLRWLVTP